MVTRQIIHQHVESVQRHDLLQRLGGQVVTMLDRHARGSRGLPHHNDDVGLQNGSDVEVNSVVGSHGRGVGGGGSVVSLAVAPVGVRAHDNAIQRQANTFLVQRLTQLHHHTPGVIHINKGNTDSAPHPNLSFSHHDHAVVEACRPVMLPRLHLVLVVHRLHAVHTARGLRS